MSTCDKLPNFFVQTVNANWNTIRVDAYNFYIRDILNPVFFFHNKIVYGSYCPDEECNQETFEHLITRDSDDSERLPDFDRLRRITWIRPLIELNCECESYKVWSYYTTSQKLRWNIWCERVAYAVVLEERPRYFRLITAFVVDSRKKIAAWKRDYQDYIDNHTGSAF